MYEQLRIMITCCASSGEDFYEMYDAQKFANKHCVELVMQTVPSQDVVYTEEKG
jgi:sulfate adenylyltransferase